MSKGATISKLEALLSRIRTRAAEPRSRPVAVAAAPVHAPPHAVVAPAPAVSAPPVVAPPVAVVSAEPASPVAVSPPAAPAPVFVPPVSRLPEPPEVVTETVAESVPPEMLEETTLPPPPLADAPGDADFDVDVDMPAATPEPAAVAAEPEPAGLTDSRERLSAAPPATPEPASLDASDTGPAIEQVEVLSDEEAVAGVAGDEDDLGDEAPASSRRPVAPLPEERLAELAFGSEEPQPARHTPPPKSGRLPAPPAVEFDGDVTGVRAHPGLGADEEVPSAQPTAPSVLSAHSVRADFGSGVNVQVPDVIGEAQAFAPATFVALLDASLSL